VIRFFNHKGQKPIEKMGLCPKPHALFCLNTKKVRKKSQGCIFSFPAGIIFACKPATLWAISCGTSRKVPAAYCTKISGENKAGENMINNTGVHKIVLFFIVV